MIDKKGSEDEFQDSFGEDFELQDESSANHPVSSTSETPTSTEKRRIPTQYILASGVAVVLVIASYFGYRYFTQRPRVASQSTKPSQAQRPKTAVTAPRQGNVAGQPVPSPKALSENDIADAFSSADKSPLPRQASTATSSQSPAPSPFSSSAQNQKSEKPENRSQESEATQSAINGQLQQLNLVLDKLNQQMETNLNQIKYLDSYTQEISKTMNKINESITAMDHRLLAVTNTTQNLSNEVGTVRNEVGQVKQVLGEDVLDLPSGPGKMPNMDKTCAVPCPVEIEYVVHAAIPGRVWLKSIKGQIITLTEGEVLGNYGKVLVIDAVNGVVLTSSGTTFR